MKEIKAKLVNEHFNNTRADCVDYKKVVIATNDNIEKAVIILKKAEQWQ
jgi:translation elongation factor EF-Ts